MRKVLLLGLVLVLSLGFIGCGGEEEFDPSGGKVVEAKYRGEWERNNNSNFNITLSEKSIIMRDPNNVSPSYQAWTDNNNLYYYHDVNKITVHLGVFENDNKLVFENDKNSGYDWFYSK